MDMIPLQGGAEGFVPHPGGAVLNTAVALGRIGAQVGLLTGLSEDIFGQQLRAALRVSHVDTRYIVTSKRPTTLAFVHLAGGQARYSFFDENSAGRMLTPQDMPQVSPDVSALFFGGISLASEPCADAYAAVLAQEGQGRLVMMDPNIREGFIADVGRYRTRLDAMIAQTDIIKVSDEDLEWIHPAAVSLQEKVQFILQKGPALVILTRGGAGATGFLRDGTELHVAAEKTTIVDTVGAGDTFNAGVLATFAAHGVLDKPAGGVLPAALVEQALAKGAQLAAVTVSRAGANPPWADEI